MNDRPGVPVLAICNRKGGAGKSTTAVNPAAELAARFEPVILDTPPSLDALLRNALVAAHLVLSPFVPHPLSFEGIRQLMRILFRVMARGNPGLKILGLLPTASVEHVRAHRAVDGDVSRQFGAHRVLPGIRSDIRLAEAYAAGKPIGEYASKSRGAQDYAALAEALLPALMPARQAVQAIPAGLT